MCRKGRICSFDKEPSGLLVAEREFSWYTEISGALSLPGKYLCAAAIQLYREAKRLRMEVTQIKRVVFLSFAVAFICACGVSAWALHAVRISDLSNTPLPPNPIRVWGTVTGVSPYRIGDGVNEITVIGLSASVGDFVVATGNFGDGVLTVTETAEVYTVSATTRMVYIPAGTFQMGNNGSEGYSHLNELPQHSVVVSEYYIGKHEVTRGEYREFMEAGGYSNPFLWSASGWAWKSGLSRTEPDGWAVQQDWGNPPGLFTQTDDSPVVGVTYYEAEAFCNWAGGQLPTEAQWEKAARWTGGYANAYPWGNVWDSEKCNNRDDGRYVGWQTSPVGSYPADSSPYGCNGMGGNVREWCLDWAKSYPGSTNPFDYTGVCRALRGGGWSSDADSTRCAFRGSAVPEHSDFSVGFRLVYDREMVRMPGTPSGNATTIPNKSETYTTSGSFCNRGHAVEYSFDWGDGTSTPWSTSRTASRSWSASGAKSIRVTARCQMNASILATSAALVVNVIEKPGDMIYIPAGPFDMGNQGGEGYSYPDEVPSHNVDLSGYYIGRYEVTRGEYRLFIDAGGYSNPAYWSEEGWVWKGGRTEPDMWPAQQDWGFGTFVQTDYHPVAGVSYHEAEAFCRWAGGSLPTEAQWEKAARWNAGTSYSGVYPWGDIWDSQKCRNSLDPAHTGVAEVGGYSGGASPYGCLDMAGNVAEWCKDKYQIDYYSQTPVDGWDDPHGPASGSYVLRGGSWQSDADGTRCANRHGVSDPSGSFQTGFRMVRQSADPLTNAVVPIVVHSGDGTDGSGDVYMRGNCRSDFADVWFEDASGSRLDYYQISKGNWSLEADTRLGTRNYIVNASIGRLNAGDIIASSVSGMRVAVSPDNGATWTEIFPHAADVLGVDLLGNIYISRLGWGLYRGVWNEDTGQWDWTLKIDIRADGYEDAGFQPYAFAINQDNGFIYAGQYQANTLPCVIYVSRDGGATWSVAYTTPVAHVHGLDVDPYTGKIYAGINKISNADNILVEGVDNGVDAVTWEVRMTGTQSSVTDMLFTPTHILLGGDPNGQHNSQCVMRMSKEDYSYSTLLNYAGTCQNLFRIGNTLFASVQPYGLNRYTLVFASTDEGASWQTIHVGPIDRDFAGLAWVSNVGTPTGSSEQAIFGFNGSRDIYKPMRLFAGGDRHQALYRVRVPRVPADGPAVYVCCDGITVAESSTVAAAGNPAVVSDAGLLARWTFDEGNGVCSNPKYSLTPVGDGQSYMEYNGARAGPAYPDIVQPGKHLNLTGAGYLRVDCSEPYDVLDITESFTMIGWVRTVPNGRTQTLFGRGNNSDKAQYVLYLSASSNPELVFVTSTGARTYRPGEQWFVATGGWVQVGVIVGPVAGIWQSIRFVVNGQVGAPVYLTAPIAATTRDKFAIGADGRDDASVYGPTVGSLDDIAVWGRMLTAEEVLALYEQRLPVTAQVVYGGSGAAGGHNWQSAGSQVFHFPCSDLFRRASGGVAIAPRSAQIE